MNTPRALVDGVGLTDAAATYYTTPAGTKTTDRHSQEERSNRDDERHPRHRGPGQGQNGHDPDRRRGPDGTGQGSHRPR